MKLVYDPEVDVLSVLLSDAPVAESDQHKPGVILDYDDEGHMVGFEILDASKRMANPMSVEYAVTPPLRRPALWLWDAGRPSPRRRYLPQIAGLKVPRRPGGLPRIAASHKPAAEGAAWEAAAGWEPAPLTCRSTSASWCRAASTDRRNGWG